MHTSSIARATELFEASLFTPDDLPHTLDAVAREIGFDHFCLVHSQLENPTFIASEHSLDALNAYATGGWREVDYRAANVNHTADGSLFLDHLVVPEEERTSSAIYNELYVPSAWRTSRAGASPWAETPESIRSLAQRTRARPAAQMSTC